MVACQTCDGGGVESTYTGEVIHPMYGKMKVEGEKRWPLLDLPGGRLFGGSVSHQCRSCKGKGGQ